MYILAPSYNNDAVGWTNNSECTVFLLILIVIFLKSHPSIIGIILGVLRREIINAKHEVKAYIQRKKRKFTNRKETIYVISHKFRQCPDLSHALYLKKKHNYMVLMSFCFAEETEWSELLGWTPHLAVTA